MEYDTSQPSPPGVRSITPQNIDFKINTPTTLATSNMMPTAKGVENAKKRLRAFSIQKKTPLTPLITPKPSGSGSAIVVIGKLSGVKPTPKREEDPAEPKVPKLPKPPKPGSERKAWQDTYSELQRRTQAEIEDMKRKMELVDLGIPLGLICPSSTNEKAMPTKAMPPIKSFIDPAKVDELIRDAKKAKLEGKPFKFDYRKLLPDYNNPFQRKKDEKDNVKEKDKPGKDDRNKKYSRRKEDYRDKKDKYSSKRYNDHKKDYKSKDRNRDRREKGIEPKETKRVEQEDKEDDKYVVCDSWSFDNDDNTSVSSPKTDDKSDSQSSITCNKDCKEPSELLRASIAKKNEYIKSVTCDEKKIKIQPITDTIKYETDDNDDEVLDIFDAESDIEKFATVKPNNVSLYDSPDKSCIDLDNCSRDVSLDDTFLESMINEIKVEEINEDSQDKGLVEYESPNNCNIPNTSVSESVTPELALKERKQDYSDGYRSNESGYKTSDTVESYKSSTEFRLSVEKQLDDALNADKMSKATVHSLEAWTFVLKICQPLLFRHDKNKCYKETRSGPKIWYTINPKLCSCVKDRIIVYDELQDSKNNLVDQVYGSDQLADAPSPNCRSWYPTSTNCLVESKLQLSSEWEADDSQQSLREERRSLTPKREELDLDREYHRFMEAVWPDVIETKKETSRSTTPVQENRKKRREEMVKREEEKKSKKMKLSSEGWSQESEIEEDERNKKKNDKRKRSKRRHSTSISSNTTDSEEDSKKKKLLKKKALKKVKSKSAKRRRIGRKILKKLKEKRKKNKKEKYISEDDSDIDKTRKSKKRKSDKARKKEKKKRKSKKASSSGSSSTDSSSDQKMSAKKRENSSKRRKIASSHSQNENLVDANILNNIKIEKITDDEGSKMMDFSPRRQKPREIINVKELQNDFVGNTHIKEEIEEKSDKDEVEENHEIIVERREENVPLVVEDTPSSVVESVTAESSLKKTRKESGEKQNESVKTPDEISQCSSQESVYSVKNEDSKSTDVQYVYEKDESHLRPSSQNSNYCFKDVISSSGFKDDKFESYEPAEYDMYEQMAMAYQCDVAGQARSPIEGGVSHIETVVRARSCGEITCDWRPGHDPANPTPHRPSRWGLKPGDANIVLTGGDSQPVYRIQSLANRNENNSSISYDEAYMDTYGASDRLQYGDCFATEIESPTLKTTTDPKHRRSTLDDRICRALRETVLGDVAKELTGEGSNERIPVSSETRAVGKRVRFADGYTPGQDSDTEPPPNKKRRNRRVGCAWPCPVGHPDHVSLWDALPPPPPPPGDPPLRRRRAIQVPEPRLGLGLNIGGFMPPKPPPGLIALH